MNAQTLRREVHLGGAILLGFGSMLGAGIFVAIGLGADVAGRGVLLAIALAALVAGLNASSSAQLAASHPVAGGTYAYGYRYLSPALGFTAGWVFLCAKSASAAAAAIGFAGYLLRAVAPGRMDLAPVVAAVTTAIVTLIVLSGVRRTNWVNALILLISIGALVGFVTAVLVRGDAIAARADIVPPSPLSLRALLEATALMFVAYTGYGRIATLSEEVVAPARTIPRAILWTLGLTVALYLMVTTAALYALGTDGLAAAARASAAPLEAAARATGIPAIGRLITLGATAAMAGVLLNLVLGLSRVVVAMGRQGDLPADMATLRGVRRTPVAAIVSVGLLVATLAASLRIEIAWSFSAFTVLVYYALTNAAALRIDPSDRRYPRTLAWGGLIACGGLAFWVEPVVWVVGLGIIAIGLGWHALAARHRGA